MVSFMKIELKSLPMRMREENTVSCENVSRRGRVRIFLMQSFLLLFSARVSEEAGRLYTGVRLVRLATGRCEGSGVISRSRSGPERRWRKKTEKWANVCVEDVDSVPKTSARRSGVSPGLYSWHRWRGQPSFLRRSSLLVWTVRCPGRRGARCRSLMPSLRGGQDSSNKTLQHLVTDISIKEETGVWCEGMYTKHFKR